MLDSNQQYLCEVQYSAVFLRPGHGDATPLASAAALYAITALGGQYTGFRPVNPSRSLASSLVFDCYWKSAWVYLAAQATASVLASVWAMVWHGRGAYFFNRCSADSSISGRRCYGDAHYQQVGYDQSVLPLLASGSSEEAEGMGAREGAAEAAPASATAEISSTIQF
ncbi:hypothetical protein CEUSTIGMA_g6699.t1 [Chlamydomonas eustigma]|uniref:Uncharacterized protein n=1 Tax=Chlamydomonas eustigma TaxID=1157962 RepID=A0A250X8L3_9CHLO|nr:hypothetical protein CEUSTIGMA_g6699.t1 [Chlamydomonas eustigma]|eukprot:GAX79259.1 hypothetical protein CEUSTIGMA_g6699.t1 [Chlamydomonas eustigma]